MLGILRKKFKEVDVDSFISLYKVFVRSHLDYRICLISLESTLHVLN